ncbi:hypothetical protein GCM10017044_22790 [Kordiimonas sediminis]|uniref:SPOR domain-containing protein n=2 Tax=Kordiimonas sediminis TaxID=1735581 RepID=A0A919E7U5_9PROT|nr:hypothetical protein GCM10017044_22790 [Kordiimonas sediminis]
MTSREEKNKFTQLEEALRVLGIEVRNTANRLEETRASVPNSDQMNAQGASIARLQSALENVNITLENFEERIAKLEQHALEIDAAERLNASAKADAAKRAEMRAIQEKFSIHVASYRARAQAQAGWDILRNALSPILDAKNARVAEDNQSGVGSVLRLLVGPYDSLDEAARACAEIKNRASDQYCEATQYMGNALSNN